MTHSALLKRLGVKGADAQLDKVVADWDGHALTISLLGSYLAEKHGGDIAHLADIPIPTADEPRYERVHRVLRRYDEHLTEPEREFLKLFSAFRTPVHEGAFEKVFVPLLGVGATRQGKSDSVFSKIFKRKKTTDGIDGSPLREMVNHLVTYRILRHDAASQTYTAHPLVRNHYLAILTHGDSTEQHDVHGKIKDYYLSITGDMPQYPTLDDLKPLIEAVHHACQAGAYDEANTIRQDRIAQGVRFVLTQVLGAWETDLFLMYEFFPDGDTTQEPRCNIASANRFILNEIGICLMSLGRLREALPFYERVARANFEAEDWRNTSNSYQNLAHLHASLGMLKVSAESACQALDFAHRAEYKNYERISLAYQGSSNHLLGSTQIAHEFFSQAERLEQEINTSIKYLYAFKGIQHAEHLYRTGDLDYAHRVTEANLQISEQNHWPQYVSMSHRVLGDLDFDSDHHESARAHYESALKIARSISVRDVLIEALLARGRFAAKTSEVLETSEVSQAFTDLNEALNYAVEGGYRIYEADIRVALAWAHLNSPRPLAGERQGVRAAKAEAERALQMSQEMGYHWGKVDAEEVLKEIGNW